MRARDEAYLAEPAIAAGLDFFTKLIEDNNRGYIELPPKASQSSPQRRNRFTSCKTKNRNGAPRIRLLSHRARRGRSS